MTSFRRGDVVLVNYVYSNQRDYEKRPALVVQASNLKTGLRQTILALITSNLKRTGNTRVLFKRNSRTGQRMGLQLDSVVMTDNLLTALDADIEKVIGWCPAMHWLIKHCALLSVCSYSTPCRDATPAIRQSPIYPPVAVTLLSAIRLAPCRDSSPFGMTPGLRLFHLRRDASLSAIRPLMNPVSGRKLRPNQAKKEICT